MNEQFFESKTLMLAVALIIFLIAVVLILLIFRLAFGRRVRLPGGRTRQQRLGLVEAFDLDRQRQLLIVRRDNTEHLIMIGGPNDLLIEAEIIRAEERLRDKDIRDTSFAPAPNHTAIPWPPSGLGQPQPAGPSFPPEPSIAPERPLPPAAAVGQPAPRSEPVYRSAPVAAERFAPEPKPTPQEVFAQPARREAEERPAGTVPPRPAPPPLATPRTPAYPMPPKRPLPPLGSLGNRMASAARDLGQTRSDQGPQTAQTNNPAAVFPRAPVATPFLRPLPQRQTAPEEKPEASAPPSSSTPETPAPVSTTEPTAPPPPQPASEPIAAQKEQKEPAISASPVPETPSVSVSKLADPVDSLEEEMAKLLGRGPSDS